MDTLLEGIFEQIVGQRFLKPKANEKKENDKNMAVLSDLIRRCSYDGMIHYSESGNLIEIYSFNDNIAILEFNDNIDSLAQKHMSKVIKTPPFNSYNIKLSDIDTNIGKNFRNKSKWCALMPLIKIQIKKDDLNYAIKCIAYLKSITSSNISKREILNLETKAFSAERLFKDTIDNFLTKLDEINLSINETNNRLKNVKEIDQTSRLEVFKTTDINIQNKISFNDEGRINLMTYNNPNNFKVKPFLYPSEILPDGNPRTFNTLTKCILSFIEDIRTRLKKGSSYNINTKNFIEEGRKPLSTEELEYIAKEELKKKERILSILKKNGSDIPNITNSMLDIYQTTIINANKGIFDEDIEGYNDLIESVAVYLSELLSTYIIANFQGNWTSLQGEDGKKVFKEVLGINKSSTNITKSSYAGYNLGKNERLGDAYLMIMSDKISEEIRKISISVKGGLNGKGAAASIASLEDFIYTKSGDITNYGKLIEAAYPKEFKMLDFLMRVSYKEYKNNIKLFNNYAKKNLGLNPDVDNGKDAIKYLNSEFNFTSCILKILQCASYEFLQLNTTPIITENGFHFKSDIQYPAVYVGNVTISANDSLGGMTKFHID